MRVITTFSLVRTRASVSVWVAPVLCSLLMQSLVLGYTVSSHCAMTMSFPYPGPGPRQIKTNGFLLCRYPECRRCVSSPECAAVHHQCFVSFILGCRLPLHQSCDALRTIVFYRRPWSKAATMKLRPGLQHAEATRRWLHKIADTSDLFRLPCLPPELLEVVRRLSPNAWLWRLTSIVDLASRVPAPAPSQQVAVGRIESWTRGTNATIASNNQQSILRITLDTEGIRTLARVPKRPDVCPSVSQDEAYLVEGMFNLPGAQVQIIVRPPRAHRHYFSQVLIVCRMAALVSLSLLRITCRFGTRRAPHY